MTCPGRDLTSELEIEHELLASPEMPRATLRIKGRKGTEKDLKLAVVSPNRLIFWNDPVAIHIDRETGDVDFGPKNTADWELAESERAKGCWFKTL